jgi:hypothetical protein
METEGQFRVIDPETGKPRPRDTETWTEEQFQAWKRLPWWQKRQIVFPPIGWFTILATAAAVALAALQK